MTSVTGHSENWARWLGHLAGQPGLKALEVGSYKGQSAIWFLENILTTPNSSITCVDTWMGGEDLPEVDLFSEFDSNMQHWKHKIDLVRDRSEVALGNMYFEPETFDFAYIDGSHTAKNVLADSVLVWRLVKPGGIIIWDDYLWEIPHDPVKEPKMAIDSFLACYHGHYKLIAHGWQVCVKKIS